MKATQRPPLVGHLRVGGDGMRETVITTREEYSRLFSIIRTMVEADELRPPGRGVFHRIDLPARRVRLITSKGQNSHARVDAGRHPSAKRLYFVAPRASGGNVWIERIAKGHDKISESAGWTTMRPVNFVSCRAMCDQVWRWATRKTRLTMEDNEDNTICRIATARRRTINQFACCSYLGP